MSTYPGDPAPGGLTPGDSATGGPVLEAEQPRRRRPRKGLIALAVVLVVLIIAVVVADFAARAYAGERIKDRIASALDIEDRDRIDVDIQGISVLAQAITGTVDQVDIALNSVSFGELTGSADVTLTGVPLDQTEPTQGIDIAVNLPADQLQTLAGGVSETPVDTVEITDSTLMIGVEFSVFSISVPVVVAVEPGAADGFLTFTPESVVFNGETYTAAELQDQFGDLANEALVTQTICVAQYLPSFLSLSDAEVRGDRLALTFSGSDTTLTGDAFRSRGSCD